MEHGRSMLPQSTVDVIEAAGHPPHLTAPDRLIAVRERRLAPPA